MKESKNITLKCKGPGPPHDVVFTGVITVPGNLALAAMKNISEYSLFRDPELSIFTDSEHSLFLDIDILSKIVKTEDSDDPVTANITFSQKGNQHLMPPIELDSLINRKQKVTKTETFYLTCDMGHTYPYQINLRT